ncbi:conserved hypothetical protein [Candidatus Blochmanniella vafra str. BVAF]|uniref:Z-ring associated protein G n=1 Tax=Blochmanniella vafra (strain BVAF) TaxID=859654 RepID=E8Q6M0_BLOVB|nr:YhcB family protein [Candidatus Blochmannia vafer]ADV33461.1 conserved hypothetical protein [Candidatus Blochmannia vafer str. BVAF]
MIWIIVILLSFLIGNITGIIFMYYRDRNLLNNQKTLYNELQNNKMKLNTYQNKLKTHFEYNIKLLNKISENYQNLYQNITKNANFFLPNVYNQENVYSDHAQNINIQHKKHLTTEAPRDYSDDVNAQNEQEKI